MNDVTSFVGSWSFIEIKIYIFCINIIYYEWMIFKLGMLLNQQMNWDYKKIDIFVTREQNIKLQLLKKNMRNNKNFVIYF